MSTLTKSDFEKVYKLLDAATPVPFDCGMICGAACCRDYDADESDADSEITEVNEVESVGDSDDDQDDVLGIFLLPGEDLVHDRDNPWLEWSAEPADEFDFPDSWTDPVWFVKCGGPEKCNREFRPIQCRTFPLMPYLDETGGFHLIWDDTELPYCCPLLEERAELQSEFIDAVSEAWRLLITDPKIRDYVILESEYRGSDVEYLLRGNVFCNARTGKSKRINQ